jgi:hypothetical protein
MASKNVTPCSEQKRKRNVLTIAQKIEIFRKISLTAESIYQHTPFPKHARAR